MTLRKRIFAAGMTWLALSTCLWAQAPSPRKVFTNKLAFNVPLKVEDSDRAVLKELRFYVKPPNGSWALQERGTPLSTRFGYQAGVDGEYWFSFATVDTMGRESPTSPDREPPRLVVVVDTKPPELGAMPLTVASGQTYVQCTMRDANPDVATLAAEIQLNDGNWKTLDILDRELPGVFRLPDAGMPNQVRVSGKDKAGNVATQVVNIDTPSSLKAVTPVAPATLPPTAPTLPEPLPAPIVPESRVAEKPVAPAVAKPGGQLLNTRRCSLSYAIDAVSPESVQRVEVFVTRDDGQTWLNLGEDPDRRSPVEIMLPEDGAYGFVVLVSTARQPAPPPTAGEASDWYIEVDATPPEVNLESVSMCTGDDAGLIALRWSVRDQHLKPDAVELFWGSTADGPWQPIAKGLRAEGQYRWPAPREAGSRAFLKIEACDLAGNVGRFVTPQSITLETAKPRAKVLGINPAAVRP